MNQSICLNMFGHILLLGTVSLAAPVGGSFKDLGMTVLVSTNEQKPWLLSLDGIAKVLFFLPKVEPNKDLNYILCKDHFHYTSTSSF